MWIELARRPATSSQEDEYANRPFVLRSLPQLENGLPLRPTQKPGTNQRKLNDEEDDQIAPDPDGYYVEDLDLDYYEEENTPTALAISPV